MTLSAGAFAAEIVDEGLVALGDERGAAAGRIPHRKQDPALVRRIHLHTEIADVESVRHVVRADRILPDRHGDFAVEIFRRRGNVEAKMHRWAAPRPVEVVRIVGEEQTAHSRRAVELQRGDVTEITGVVRDALQVDLHVTRLIDRERARREHRVRYAGRREGDCLRLIADRYLDRTLGRAKQAADQRHPQIAWLQHVDVRADRGIC